MHCPNCGTANSPRVKFCAECGSPLGVPCPECSFRNTSQAAVCGGCGRSLQTGPAPAAERRQITVFFADLAGSTALAERLDPEDLRELYDRYQQLCAECIQQYDGHLAQYLGDGILAYFGYPSAHEDAASRAIFAGLDIQNRVSEISVGGHHPQVRIGIHTGLVVMGDVGTGKRREQLALGEAPNIAARLQSEALPGTVVISDATRRLTGGTFLLTDLGSRTLKGLSRPMHVFEVPGRNRASNRFQAMTAMHGLTSFVGREREMALIASAWEQASAGHGQTLLLIGEAGIGKSRLLSAARLLAGERLHEALDGQCSAYQTSNPLYPILELVERRLGFEPGMDVAMRLDLIEQFAAGRGVASEDAVPLLAELLSVPLLDRYAVPVLPAAKRLTRQIQILAQLLTHSVGGVPVVLVIEDVHWADPSTLDLLGEVLALQSELPVLTICTSRPGFRAAWLDHPGCLQIPLQALGSADARTLVASVAGGKPLPPMLVDELIQRTGGIPLFVEAVTRTVIESGILRERDNRYELAGPLPPGLIPSTLQDSLMGRIDRLGPHRAVAQLAATIGPESGFELLQLVLGYSAADLNAALRRMIELDLIQELGEPPHSTYTFRHALIQDAAYESLLKKTRQEYHGKIAEVLAQRFPDVAAAKPELMARHFEGAGRSAEAISGWMQAAERARVRSALRESASYLQHAVTVIKTLPEESSDRHRLESVAQLSLSRALPSTAGWGSPGVEAACLRARDLCLQLGDIAGLIHSLLGLTSVYHIRGRIQQALESADAVLKIALQTTDPILRMTAHQVMAYNNCLLPGAAALRHHAEAALSYYEPERERELVAIYHVSGSALCAQYLASGLWVQGNPAQADHYQQWSWALTESFAHPYCTVNGLALLISNLFWRRDPVEAARLAERLFQLAEEEGLGYYVALARIFRGVAMGMAGRVSEGLAELQAGWTAYTMTGAGILTPWYCAKRAELLAVCGRADEALGLIDQGIRHSEEFCEGITLPELYRVRGELQLTGGDRDAGEASLKRAIDVARDHASRMLEMRASLALARLWNGDDRRDDALALVAPFDGIFPAGFQCADHDDLRNMLDLLNQSRGDGASAA